MLTREVGLLIYIAAWSMVSAGTLPILPSLRAVAALLTTPAASMAAAAY